MVDEKITDTGPRTVPDLLNPDKRFTKLYTEKLISHVNEIVKPEERELYKELINIMIEENGLDKPQDLMMLEMAIYDYLRVRRVQKIVTREGDTFSIQSQSGNSFTKVNEASYLLNSIETQLRNLMKDMGLSRGERIKKKLGVDTQDFASFMSDDKIIDANIVENIDKIEKNDE